MIIALASPRVASSIDEGLEKVEHCMREASLRGARIVCFPEAYLPGLRGVESEVPEFERGDEERVIKVVGELARSHDITTVLGTETLTDGGRQIAAVVFGSDGLVRGTQVKTQLAPSEDPFYVPGSGRQMFEADGVKFGVAICHEAWRYPETVRWAAVRGAKIVFQPQHSGRDHSGIPLTDWGDPRAPYYEKAMMCRGLENTIYFASVNYALRFQDSATTLIDPSGRCQAHLAYGEEGVLVQELDLEAATGLLAGRFAPDRYGESD